MQMSSEIVEFSFSTVPDNSHCLKLWEPWIWNNELELVTWYEWTGNGEGVSVHVKDSVIIELSSSIQIDFFIQIQYRLQSPFPTLAPKSTLSCDMSDMQSSIWWLTYKARNGYSVLLIDTAQSHPSRRRKRPNYYVHKMMDHIYSSYLANSSTAHIT